MKSCAHELYDDQIKQTVESLTAILEIYWESFGVHTFTTSIARYIDPPNTINYQAYFIIYIFRNQ